VKVYNSAPMFIFPASHKLAPPFSVKFQAPNFVILAHIFVTV